MPFHSALRSGVDLNFHYYIVLLRSIQGAGRKIPEVRFSGCAIRLCIEYGIRCSLLLMTIARFLFKEVRHELDGLRTVCRPVEYLRSLAGVDRDVKEWNSLSAR